LIHEARVRETSLGVYAENTTPWTSAACRACDIDYYASRLQGEPAEGVSDIHFHPTEPRSVRLTLSMGF
jgi:hypothetical protein